MSYDIAQENKEILARYKDLITTSYRILDEDQNKLIRKAFDMALDAHKNQRRKSGEPYIYHPIEVAKIVAKEIGLGATSIACALLHDVIEDSEYTYEDIQKAFGDKIAYIVNSLTKISVMNHQNISVQSENYRKLLLTLSDDFRVILIKIADRLHNMRTLGSMPLEKQKKIAAETSYIYAPLAHRLGFYSIKSELEDLSLKFINPEIYFDIEKKLADAKEIREQYLKEISEAIRTHLEEEDFEFQIKARAKAISSIYRKMLKQSVSFEEVYDNYAIRIIYTCEDKDEKFIAWKIYSIITSLFHSNPSRMRDWISQPRSTGYESLHLTILGPDKKWIEVQIRSERMNEIAEKGVAAHYKYKEDFRKNTDDSNFEQWIRQIREVLENQQDFSTSELLDNIKLNLYQKEVFVFTPKGEIKILPKGSTALDFAFSVHSDLGLRCLGAKVNGKLVPISHQLKNGDQIEILSSKNQRPKQDWLEFVNTSKARNKIKAVLNTQKNAHTEEGKEIMLRKLRHAKIPSSEKDIHKLQKYLGYDNVQEMYLAFREGKIPNTSLRRFIENKNIFTTFLSKFKTGLPKPIIDLQQKNKTSDLIVFGKNEEKLPYKMAKCCTVVPGDPIFGFLTINEGIKIHHDACVNAMNLRAQYAHRVMPAKWADSAEFKNRVKIVIEGLDRIGLLNDVSQIISRGMGINIISMNFSADDGIFFGEINLEVHNKPQLDETIQQLKQTPNVLKVRRI